MSRLRYGFLLLLPLGLLAQPVTGFFETRLGGRLQSDPTQDAASIREARLQLAHSRFLGPADVQVKADLVYDDLVTDREDLDLDRGEGWLDLRTASAAFRPAMWMDLKVGRQVLTWGTGDLLFLNDLFPKDWRSFFNGRDVEYLKAPSDAAWISLYPGEWTVDVVLTPEFDSDRFLDGRGISFYPQQFSPTHPMPAELPTGPEWALRLARNLESLELAFYGYEGYWKSPTGFSDQGLAVFPELRVGGVSVLTPLGEGLLNLETAYYDSLQDRSGDQPELANSEVRFLAGYTRELRKNLTLGVQGYVEWMQEYTAYRESLPEGMPRKDEVREVTTVRLSQLMWNQNLMLSGFLFVSPTDRDGYLRGKVEYKWSDTLTTTVGVNVFAGERDDTFFGQFADNTNLYLAVRRWF